MTPPVSTKFPHNNVRSAAGACGNDDSTDDRSQTRSPVNFREGRRASDSLMSQHMIPFHQRLKDTNKTRGVAELRKEMECLQTHYRTNVTDEELASLQEQHQQYKAEREKQNAPLQWTSLDEAPQVERPKLSTKRKSLPTPGHFDFSPHKLLALKQAMQVQRHLGDGPPPTNQPAQPVPQPGGIAGGPLVPPCAAPAVYPTSIPLSQQLLQHKLQQKRQIFQKHSHSFSAPPGTPLHQQFQQMTIEGAAGGSALLPPQSLYLEGGDGGVPLVEQQPHQQQQPPGEVYEAPLPQDLAAALHQATLQQQQQQQLALMRRHVIRQTSYKLAQQQTVMPPLGAGVTEDMIPPWQLVALTDPPPLSPMFEEGEGESNGEGGVANEDMEMS